MLGAHHTDSRIRTGDGPVDEPLFDREELDSAEPPVLESDRHRLAVAPDEDRACVLAVGLCHRDHPRVGEQPVGKSFKGGGVDGGAGRQPFATHRDHFATAERGVVGRQSVAAEQLARNVLKARGVELDRLRAADDLSDLAATEPQLGRAHAPLVDEALRVNVPLLGATRRERGRLGGPRPVRATISERRLDLGSAPAEGAEDPRGDAINLGDAVTDLGPGDAQLARQLRPQHRLVNQARGPSVSVEPSPVERRPLEVTTSGEVGDDDVRVKLRIAGP